MAGRLPTIPGNLVLVCTRHHRLVHERGWAITARGPELTFVRPDGRPVIYGPPPMGLHIQERVHAWGLVGSDTS